MRSPEALARLELIKPAIATAATLAHERKLGVAAGVSELVPSGHLQRGSTLAVHGAGATSFALGLVGEAIRDGAFMAVVAPRSFGLGMCIDFDIPLRRVVQFSLDGSAAAEGAGWAKIVAAIADGFDVVVIADHRRVSVSHARLLTARVRERGSVLVRVGGPSWAEAPDLRYDLTDVGWRGLGGGHGYLQARRVTVQVAGRRWRGAPRRRLVELGVDHVAGLTCLVDTPEAGRMSGVVEPVHAGADIDAIVDAVDPVDASLPAARDARLDAIA